MPEIMNSKLPSPSNWQDFETKEKAFSDDFRDLIEYIIHNDPCGSPISVNYVEGLDEQLRKWTIPDLYSKNKSFKKIQKEVIGNLHDWIILMNPCYMHEVQKGRALSCNDHQHEILEELRSKTMTIRQSLYDNLEKIYDTDLI